MKLLMNVLFLIVAGMCCLPVAYGQEKETVAYSKPVRVSFKAKDQTAPGIFLVYNNAGALTADGKVEVTIRIFDDGGLGAITINDEQFKGEKKDSVIYSYAFAPGQEVNIKALDASNNAKEKQFVIKGQVPVAIVTSGPVVPQHKFYALLMGVEKYDDSEINPLTEPIKDATLLRKVLIEKYTFDEKDITFLKNPTGDEMQIAFEELSTKATPEDFVLIFFAGHGYFDEKKNAGYWFPRDARKANTARWFRNSTLVEDIGAIPAKHTLLIADACFSGGIFLSRAPFNNASLEISTMMKRQSRKAMTSGSLTTVPDKSVFMKYLLQVLNENNEKYLSTEKLFEQLRPIVRNNTDTEPRYGEIKNTNDEGGTFLFIRKE
jgi:Caspase domain